MSAPDYRWVGQDCLLRVKSPDLELLIEALADLRMIKNNALSTLRAEAMPNLTETGVGLPQIIALQERVSNAYLAEPEDHL